MTKNDCATKISVYCTWRHSPFYGSVNRLFFVIGISFILVALILIIRAFITRRTTELGITTKRVIAKIGLIRRNTIELNHSKVESFNVDQSILGRILDFGTIIIQGTGGGKTPIKGIDSPLKFRQEAMAIIDKSGN